MTDIMVVSVQSQCEHRLPECYRLKAICAIDTSISRAIQTTSRYDFRTNDILPTWWQFPDMTIAVDWDVKQQFKSSFFARHMYKNILRSCEPVIIFFFF